jgi:hypothetical protein
VFSFGQDTIVKKYSPFRNYKVYSVSLTTEQRINNSFVKVIDLRGKTRFIGQVWSDCGRQYNGDTKEYYKNGNTKAIRKYKIEGIGCPRKNGIWTYYKKNGKLKKTIVYKSGVLVSEVKS